MPERTKEEPELPPAGVAMAMAPDDVGTPVERDLGVHVARGMEPWRILAHYLARVGGPARGDAHEAMTFAGTRRLPVVFVCDNNQFAFSTPTRVEFATEQVADRAHVYGFEGVVVDGTDFAAVYREACRAIEKAREGGGPTLLECQTLRLEGHGAHDDAFYVPGELLAEWADRDPVARLRTLLRETCGLSDSDDDETQAGVLAVLGEALDRAEASPLPDPETLLDGVYASAAAEPRTG